MSNAEYLKSVKFCDAMQEYNQIFSQIGLDYLIIGNDNSCYKNTKYWNLRDLVSEAKYQYKILSDRFKSTDFDLLLTSDREEMMSIIIACRLLKEFIDKYKFSIALMSCFDRHSSKYDRLSLNA